MNKSTWLGIIVGFGAILLGNVLEGGHVSSLMQLTAAIIVLGGTAGAVLVSNPSRDIKKGMQLFKQAFFEEETSHLNKNMNFVVDCARIARKDGMIALENKVAQAGDSFLSRILRNMIDGLDAQVVRGIAEAEIDHEEYELLNAAKIWTDAGGYAPTIGIIGAVLGLIHVMGNLSDTSKLGAGIAVAFVATVYGVGSANLLFLPLASKIKKRILNISKDKRSLLEAALLISPQVSPLVVEQKLKASVVEL